MLNKSELVEKLNAIVESAKLSKTVKSEFDALLTELTQRKSREIKNPDIFDEKTQTLMRFCKYHQRYEKDSDMIAKKSYCKVASFISNNRRNEVKRLENELLNLISLNADNEKISELANIIKEKKALMHAPETYDYEKDYQFYTDNCKQRKSSDAKE